MSPSDIRRNETLLENQGEKKPTIDTTPAEPRFELGIEVMVVHVQTNCQCHICGPQKLPRLQGIVSP